MPNIQPSNAVHYKLKDKIQGKDYSFKTSISTKAVRLIPNVANKRVWQKTSAFQWA